MIAAAIFGKLGSPKTVLNEISAIKQKLDNSLFNQYQKEIGLLSLA